MTENAKIKCISLDILIPVIEGIIFLYFSNEMCQSFWVVSVVSFIKDLCLNTFLFQINCPQFENVAYGTNLVF